MIGRLRVRRFTPVAGGLVSWERVGCVVVGAGSGGSGVATFGFCLGLKLAKSRQVETKFCIIMCN